jgi:hypothetical protein
MTRFVHADQLADPEMTQDPQQWRSPDHRHGKGKHGKT